MVLLILREDCELPIGTMTSRPFSEQLAAMKIRGKWGFIGHDDRIAIQPTYDEVSDFKIGLAVVKTKGFLGVMDKSGKQILQPRYETCCRFATWKYYHSTK